MNLSQEAGNSTAELLFVNFNQDATYVGRIKHCTLDCRKKSNKQFVDNNWGCDMMQVGVVAPMSRMT